MIIAEKTSEHYYLKNEGDYEKADVIIRIKITHEPLPYKTTPKIK